MSEELKEINEFGAARKHRKVILENAQGQEQEAIL